jgi:hypothetical protein
MNHGFVRRIQACLHAQASKDRQQSIDNEVHSLGRQHIYRVHSNYNIDEASYQNVASHASELHCQPPAASGSGLVCQILLKYQLKKLLILWSLLILFVI